MAAFGNEGSVFTAAAAAAEAYATVAAENLRRLSCGGDAAVTLERFDTKRMAGALQEVRGGETQHYVVHALVRDHKLSPVSLHLLWTIHSDIMVFNMLPTTNRQTATQTGLVGRCQAIIANSRLLGAMFDFTGAVSRAGLGRRVFFIMQSRSPWPPTGVQDQSSVTLRELSDRHQQVVQNILAQLRSEFPDLTQIDAMAEPFSAPTLPLWITMKDHPGARVINDVWFPKEYAEPLLKSLAAQQAEAMRHR